MFSASPIMDHVMEAHEDALYARAERVLDKQQKSIFVINTLAAEKSKIDLGIEKELSNSILCTDSDTCLYGRFRWLDIVLDWCIGHGVSINPNDINDTQEK